MAVDTRIRLESSKLRDALTGGQGALTRFLESYARRVVAEAVMRSPVKTGNLRRSIHAEPVKATGPFTAEVSVEAAANYAMFVHEGSRPHLIRPKSKKALRFEVDGREVFAKHANHPGTKPRPFLRNAMEAVARDML